MMICMSRAPLVVFLVLLSACGLARSQTTVQQQQILVDDANGCPANTGDTAPLENIKPSIFYFNVGGGVGVENVKNQTAKYVFDYGYDDSEFSKAKIDGSLPTKVVIHGFGQSYQSSGAGLLQSMVETVNWSPTTKYNVYLLNWPNTYFSERDGYLTGYDEVSASTRAVGNYLGQFLKRMQDSVGLDLGRTQVIGFSLGGQVAGFTGKYLKSQETKGKLGRITGFDPAAPCFQDVAPSERLEPGDATYVDVIHTNRAGFGTSLRSGNRDIIINDGRTQPGCTTTDYFCNHLRVFNLFNYKVNPSCRMIAYQCADYEKFLQGNCGTCPSDNHCTLVNFPINFGEDEFESGVQNYASVVPEDLTDSTQKQHYYIQTGDLRGSAPCLQHYQVRIFTEPGANITELALNGENGKTFKVTPYYQTEQLWTALLTYDGIPTLFHEAVASLTETSKKGFLYVWVGFMSHLDSLSRASSSSYLCSSSSNSNKLGVCSKEESLKLDSESLKSENN